MGIQKRKRDKKRERFIKNKKEKKGFEFKAIYIIPILIIGVIVFITLLRGKVVKSPPPPPPPPSNGNPATDSGDTVKTEDPNSLYFPISKINDGKAHFYEHQSSTGKTIKFFILKSSDGIFRAAFDACDVCFREGKGYRQEGDYMICNNCGRKFLSTKINEIKGGCNPAPLDRHMEDANNNEVALESWTEDGYLVIKKSDIEAQGAKYF